MKHTDVSPDKLIVRDVFFVAFRFPTLLQFVCENRRISFSALYFEYFTDCITLKLADFDGRARRREYWGYVLFYSIIAFVFIFIDILLDLGLVLPKIVSLIFALPSLAVSVRRLHDVGKPGYYILSGLIPILGAFYLLFLFIEDSEPEENAYGPNPKSL